jgi:hypothetical protein
MCAIRQPLVDRGTGLINPMAGSTGTCGAEERRLGAAAGNRQ